MPISKQGSNRPRYLILSPRPKEDGAYEDESDRLKVEVMEAGVTLHLGEEEYEEWDEEELM